MSGPGLNRAVFLDRDGILVVPEFRDGRSYAPRRLQNFAIYPEARRNLDRLKRAGFSLVVVTNQPDVGAGLLERGQLEEMHRLLREALPVDEIAVCCHTREDRCACRKPEPGLIHGSADQLRIDLAASYMVGDRASDIEAGARAGCRTVFVDLCYTAEPTPDGPTANVSSLGEAVDWILADSKGGGCEQEYVEG
ncbi:D-glycero-alpha-D-manno-heptose-1,7-bisphosphate 7-phosphatase [Ferrovibrio xuzhouensis]|uniref:D,D-heptose 1,7-bisphosphate phosphatase n=1 Tax=Ferrovibrio xuzhouensis TaxID=1576914 RepID=A0ABV7VBM1_9PROT